MKKKNTKPTQKALEVTESVNTDDIVSDVNGSYTGCPTDDGEPIQDVDDL